MNKNTVQGRTWTFLIYPDSAPENWKDVFADLLISGAYSMEHHAETEDGKAHYHCILEFPSNMTLGRVRELLKVFSPGVTTPFLVYDKPRMYRYLSHMDDKDKDSYDPNEVTYFNVPYWEYINTQGGLSDTLNEIVDWCNITQCQSFRELYTHALCDNNIAWMSFICNHVFFFKSFLSK